jgi:hypothetical protein
LQNYASEKVNAFLTDPAKRHKDHTPNLGTVRDLVVVVVVVGVDRGPRR